MILKFATSSHLAALVRPVGVSGLTRLVQNAHCQHKALCALTAVNKNSTLPCSYVSDAPQRPETAPDLQNSSAIKELLRYSTHFPDAMYGHVAGLTAGRPFPTAVDMNATRQCSHELSTRGFQVADCPAPADGMNTRAPHLPGGCIDVVAALPGPRDLHIPNLFAEARRLMAAGGYLAVAWNDRDLTSAFVSDVEALLERINPHYCRSSRQHTPAAVLAALSDGGALQLHSFTSLGHSLPMACAAVLQDILGGLDVVRPYLAASSAHRKAFHQEVRAIIRNHFGDDESSFGLPLTTKLFVMKHASPSATSHAAAAEAEDTHSRSSSNSDSCGCLTGSNVDSCMTHHIRSRRVGLSSRDSCALRHLYA